MKTKKFLELELFARDVTDHISNTALLALFLAHKANGQIENTPCSAMCVRGGCYFVFDAAPTAKRQQTCMLKCSASHLAPCDGNTVTVDMPFESHQSLL